MAARRASRSEADVRTIARSRSSARAWAAATFSANEVGGTESPGGFGVFVHMPYRIQDIRSISKQNLEIVDIS